MISMEQELYNTWALMYKPEIIEKKLGNLSICIHMYCKSLGCLHKFQFHMANIGVGMCLFYTDKSYIENDQLFKINMFKSY